MKDSLLPIYRAVAEGRLTQAEALVRIRAIKAQAHGDAQGVLLATRGWTAAPLRASASAGRTQPAGAVLLWGLGQGAAEALRVGLPGVGIVEFLPTPSKAVSQAIDTVFADVTLQAFNAIRAMLASRPVVQSALFVVADAEDGAVAAGLDAMCRTAREENPALAVRTVRVPPDIATDALLRLVLDECVLDQCVQDECVQDERAAPPHGGAVRYARDGDGLRRDTADWRVLEQGGEDEAPCAAPVVFKEGGCYLVTGGAGGIGLRFASEIIAQTAQARIVLVGRSELRAETVAVLDRLRSDRHRIDYVALDVAQADAVESLIARLREEGQPLNGVLHCAGITRDAFIIRKSPEDFAAVLAPKVAGLANLDHATREAPLDFMLLCSSFASCWGIVGQVDYAAANAFMDAFAAHRNRLAARDERSGRTLSVNWPLWQDGGMDIDAATRERLQDHTGMRPLRTAVAMRTVYRGLTLPCDTLLVMEGELPVMRALLEGEPAAARSGADDIAPSHAVASAPPVSIAVGEDAFKTRVLDYITQQFSQVLKIPAVRLRPQAALEHYGIDSILAMKLVNHLETLFGRLPKTLAFEYQTIAELADYFRTEHAQRLIELLAPREPAQPTLVRAPKPVATQTARPSLPGKRIAATTSPAAAAPQSVPRSNRDADASHEPIAIVGLSGRYPQAWDLDGFWRNLSEGRDCVGEVPPERWRWQDHYRNVAAGETLAVGQHSSKWGGFIEGADEFDPRFFGITPRDAEQIDPQERLFLQHAWMAMEDAGYSRAALRVPRADGLPGQVGVYAGVMYGEYNRSGSLASIANRVSYVLNLHGPSMTLDTMCSSSLTALHLACQDLRLGRTHMALAGGVNLSLHPDKYSMLSGGQFISSAGHCQSFGDGGDGYIPGEGVGVAVLKRLSDAVRDGDAIHALIRGSALNHGGKTNGYTVPNPQAQAAVIVDALRDAGVDARHVSYVEAHGTGTKLGDPIEIAALGRAFGVFTQDTGFCLIGSAKSNVGHCESAAGIAGLSKVVLQMRHRQIVPSLHSQRLNPHIDFEATPFEVNQRLRAWEAPVVDGQRLPRIAGLSSFGAGGSNAHLVIEEYIGEQVDAAATHGVPAIVPLSARTLPQLRQKAVDLKAFVERHAALDLHALAYTLQTGREAMDERLGMRVASRADLLDKLALFLAADGHEDGAIADDVYYAQSRRHRDAMALFDADEELQASVDNWFGAGKFARLLEVWSKGLDLDWLKLYGNALPLRMHLPAYPFARERYWRDAPTDAAGIAGPATEALHSLVHRNASKPGQQRYHSNFRAEDPRIGGLTMLGQAMLPHGIQIETARAALVDALPMAASSGAWELQSVRFAAPRALRDQAAVQIAILPPGQGMRSALDRVAFELSAEAADGHVDCQGLAEPCADAAAPIPVISTLLRNAVPVFADPETLHAAWRALGVEVDGLYRAAETLHRTADGLLLRLAPSDAAQQAFADCVIDPVAAEAAMLAAQWLQGAPGALRLPASIARVRAFAVRGRPRLAWIRASAATAPDDTLRVDIVACTEDGSVCFEMQALELVPAVPVAVVRTEPQAIIPAPIAAISVAQPAVENVVPARMQDRVFRARAVASERDSAAVAQGFGTHAVPAKPQAVVLAAPDQGAAVAQSPTAGKPSAVSLTVGAVTAGTDAAASVLLRDRGNGILVLELRATEGRLDASLADALQQALAQAGELPSLKALVLDSDAGAFPQDSRAALQDETVQALLRTLAAFPLPTVAMLRGDAVGAGFRLACACDLVLADEARRYGFVVPDGPVLVDAAALHWLAARFGELLARPLATADAPWTGRELQQAGWGATVLPADRLDAALDALCANLADKPQGALRLLKAHLAREFQDLLDAPGAAVSAYSTGIATVDDAVEDDTLAVERDARGIARLSIRVDAAADTAQPTPEPDEWALSSPVVHASVDADGVVLVRMEDRAARNMFSDALIAGMQEVFDRIAGSPACRAVVLVGYDTYFASGGTRDGLKAIQEGKVRFTDLDIFQLPMRCPLPVIAAMQGHGIGAGWTLGLFCDSVVFSQESRYVSPYMNFGFTPGAGATGILPAKLGFDLARDSLFTGRELSGAELAQRNPMLAVRPRQRVLGDALALARSYAAYPRDDLIAWKAARVTHRFDDWQALLAREVAMHEATLVGQADALDRIESRFAGAMDAEQVAAVASAAPIHVAAPDAPSTPQASARADILPEIRRLLAEELRIDDAEIDPRAQFVDLGLDSISSVTWIRRINERFGLEIEATKVYTYPNLHRLAQHIGESLSADAPAADAVADGPVIAPPVALAASRARVDLGTVRRSLIELLAQELRQEPESIDAHRGFVELGLDSISGVTWIRAINKMHGTSIEATRIYTYPTVEKFARYLRDMIAERDAQEGSVPAAQMVAEASAATSAAAPAHAVVPSVAARFDWPPLQSWCGREIDDALASTGPATKSRAAGTRNPAPRDVEIAVIGMSGRFPMAKDLDSFWDNIANGRDCISEVPKTRWDTDAYYVQGQPRLGQSNSKWMGVLEGHDHFDPQFFGLSPVEAESMDPQQRVFLQNCWHGMENAGYTAERLSGSRCGVFVGCANGDYNLLSREQQTGALGFTGGATSILAARVSYFLNLQGPCITIDTACSSSLVAIASACDSLVTGGSDMAFAGGVYVMANADMFLKTASAGMLSPDGRCYTFDQRANGFVPGEGVGVVLLKRLADAERDGDPILGTIRGWGVNQDGRTNGITAPNAESQERLIRDVYDRFGIDAAAIQLIEAHGTGTKLGDPIEIDGLKSAFRPITQEKQFCAIGSVKTNIGHCLTAAGVSGFIKLLLALKHQKLPPSINFETPNEHLDLKDSPFYVNTSLKDWAGPPGAARHAAISSFGFSGTNAHLVLSEYTPAPRSSAASPARPEAGCLVVLSARTAEQLVHKAIDLRRFIANEPDLELASVACSLLTQRDAMDERLCFVASSLPDMLDRLAAYIERAGSTGPLPAGIVAAHVKQGRESVRLLSDDPSMAALVIDKCIAEGNLAKLGELWVKGLVLDGARLFGTHQPAVVALPAYPFAKDAYWIVAGESAYTSAPSPVDHRSHHLHPLLQERLAGIGAMGHLQADVEHSAGAEAADKPMVMHLPTYEFARMRCWIPTKDEVRATTGAATDAATPQSQQGRLQHNMDSIAELFAQLEQDTLTAGEVADRVKQLA